MYADAEQLLIREQDKATAHELLEMLWGTAPYYGDPVGLAKGVGLPAAENYEQALAKQQA